VDADLDTLLTALYVEIDDHVIAGRRGPGRPRRLSDAELACLAVAQVLPGFASERRWAIGVPDKRSLIAYDH
jgi:hypothetical protein